MTVLLVEQNVEKTLGIVDRAYLLSTGEVAFAGPPGELRQHVDIESAYLGRSEGRRDAGIPG
ncbi:MAG: hypothetical protein QJR03_11555 [Sphaerobacter sp.]|nr:hypothetical protein [Sphaerobacter sp.]